MNTRLLKYAAPLIAGLGILAVTAPASARCYYDSYGYRQCYAPPPPPVYYAPPPVVYAPPPPAYYVAPPPRVVVGPSFYPRHYGYGHGYGRPVVNFGIGVGF